MSREEEVEVLESIYPELKRIDSFSGSIEISVVSDQPVKIVLTVTADKGDDKKSTVDQVDHLPPLDLYFSVPKGYPERVPPELILTCPWLPDGVLNTLHENCIDLWKDCRCECLYSIIDELQSKARGGFGVSEIAVDSKLRDIILTHNERATVREFESHSFHCAICQRRKRGNVCTRLTNCGHVFCSECLEDYYSACVEQGYVSRVVCPAPECKTPAVDFADLKKLLSPDQLDRLDRLRKKQVLESDPNTAIVCPRNFCQALIRRNPDDNLVICSDCQFAFCAVCKRSWHGYYEYCRIQEPPDELILEYIEGDESTRARIETQWGRLNMKRYATNYENDKAFREYMEKQNNRRCPKCYTPIEKSMGCNKMTCAICHTFFCFICLDILSQDNPYRHYGDPRSGCYQRLFEGMESNELDVMDALIEH
uniref:RBR-type E3 ubiquitin transferase n=1 Tax=Blastobotrys adeninivorans TaxID=409370 RepID=A0A060TCM5_BLAAD